MKREKFFSNKLILWLWDFVFFNNEKKLFKEHLKRIRSYPFEGEVRFRSLIIDIKNIETKLGIQILPDDCKNTTNITVFTHSEAEKEATINTGKFNKRYSDQILQWFQNHPAGVPINIPKNKNQTDSFILSHNNP